MTQHTLVIVNKNDFRKNADCLNLNNINTSMDIVRNTDIIFLSDGWNSSILKDRTGLLQHALVNRFKAFENSKNKAQAYKINIDNFLFIKKYRIYFENEVILKTYNKKLAHTMLLNLKSAYIRGIGNLINN